jgi:hypothetical protein
MDAEHAKIFIDNLWELSKGIECYFNLLRYIDEDKLDGIRGFEYEQSPARKLYWYYRQVAQSICKAFPGNQFQDFA